MNIGCNDNSTVVTQGSQELCFSLDHDLSAFIDKFVSTAPVLSQSADILIDIRSITAESVGHCLFTLYQLDVQLFNDMEFDGIVIVTRLIPRLTAEVFLEVL